MGPSGNALQAQCCQGAIVHQRKGRPGQYTSVWPHKVINEDMPMPSHALHRRALAFLVTHEEFLPCETQSVLVFYATACTWQSFYRKRDILQFWEKRFTFRQACYKDSSKRCQHQNRPIMKQAAQGCTEKMSFSNDACSSPDLYLKIYLHRPVKAVSHTPTGPLYINNDNHQNAFDTALQDALYFSRLKISDFPAP